jgi:hypothetical protein
MKQRRYCGKGDVIDKTEFSSEQLSWVLEREGKGRNRCVRERVEVVRVFEEL